MKTVIIETPAMYADHHVVEVRKVLSELQGVEDIYASSAFQVVEVTYDPDRTSENEITECLASAGYLNELAVPSESSEALEQTDIAGKFLRHTDYYETTNRVVSFARITPYSGRPLWNCPGIGILTNQKLLEKMEE